MSHVHKLINSEPSSWLQILETDYMIHVVRDEDLVSLKYNQIESPMHEPIVQECRGMVVDTWGGGRILAHPYNKFWNHGDPLAAPIDWATARVQEKLDGSLMILYFHHRLDRWCVASSGHPTAGGSFGTGEGTFREAFWRTFEALGMVLPGGVRATGTYREYTFMFELCARENRVVVRHEQPRLVLHGVRRLLWGGAKELNARELRAVADLHRWELVREYPITSIEECLRAAEALDPTQTEGFVVVDAHHNRVKIKSPRYVILHHMKGEATPRRAIELWQTGEAAELLGHFPEMAGAIQPIHEQLDQAAARTLEILNAHRVLPTRKDFALAVKDLPEAAAVFLLYKEPSPTLDDAKRIMRGQSLAALERLVERLG